MKREIKLPREMTEEDIDAYTDEMLASGRRRIARFRASLAPSQINPAPNREDLT